MPIPCLLHNMCADLPDADLNAIRKARGFKHSETAARTSFASFFVSSIGVAEAMRDLSVEEVITLHLLHQTGEVDIAFFERLYGSAAQSNRHYYGTYTQQYKPTFDTVKKNLVRRGLLIMAEVKMRGDTVQMERWRFALPPEFVPYLPPLLPAITKMEHGPYKQINAELLESRNRLLADILYELLENSSHERVFLSEALPTAYARLPEKDGYPPYHWIMLLSNDERMETNGWDIVYRDGKESMLDSLFEEISGTKRKPQKKSTSKEQKEQVYRFKAELKHRPRIWRMIEVQGKNTLSDFNEILVDVFDHDFDHLGGFWKLVPRGGAKRGVARYREVDLGSVDPFGGGEGAAVTIAELELAVGNKIKYVFDFGDWIEHVLTLETIEPSQPNAKYPREAKRNTPKYANCVECPKKGKDTTAMYVCLTCTKNPDEERLLCEDCVEKHESKDHYVEKILY